MMAFIPVLVIAGIATGPILAKIQVLWLKRLSGWLVLLVLVACANFALIEHDAVSRMVGICCVLLASMKGLVYAEWAVRQRLPLSRYLVFAILWFGMDPGTFQHRREGLSWKNDVLIGLLLMMIGTLGAWLVWAMEWHQILIMFLPMSLGFHFGALRVLKGGLRAAGFPVRTLFPNLLKAQGIGDFWSRRWNVGYSQMMQRLVGRPIETRYGTNAGMMAIFLASGLLHELAITLPVRAGFGLPTLYFTLHGLLTLIEKKTGRQFGKITALFAVMAPMGLLFPPAFQTEVIQECLGVFDLLRNAFR
jgi:alginate O-acetyltransferase complex protein AlgI